MHKRTREEHDKRRDTMDRRDFLRTSAVASGGLTLGLAGSSQAGAESNEETFGPVEITGPQDMPMGKLNGLEVSRLISGANVFHGFAHSRDLDYVHQLMRRYNTEERLMETLAEFEENGVNAIIGPPWDPFLPIIDRYWEEYGGNMKFISDCRPDPANLEGGEVQLSIDRGASAIYVNGVLADEWCIHGREELLGDSVQAIKQFGVPAGIGGHSLEPMVVAEEVGFDADFYMKTLHHHDYWSCDADEAEGTVGRASWALEPERTIEFMQEVDKPFIAFKVMAAGAIPPRDGFQYAFENGADFVCAGIFDWQIEEDCRIAREVLNGLAETGRQRPWRA